MKYKVRAYQKHTNVWECLDSEGSVHLIDLMVNGDFPEDTDPEFLVGKTVEVDRMHTYISIAHGVRVVEENIQPTESK